MSDDYMVSRVSTAPLDASETSAGHGVSRLARAVNWLGDRSGLEVTDLTFDGIIAMYAHIRSMKRTYKKRSSLTQALFYFCSHKTKRNGIVKVEYVELIRGGHF